ncbi:E3 ubiquitin-protein ligase APD2 isoform X2 [Telopea speciosissima]|uniref:E3 ubiquitin-protein ligase APD2 isoform X2 n=1 Tax=Telopea speciosissima TaxID=54955 RepID=UPI001CC66BBC|nr:E3 ubiquitin-protein ligase APD2 isoform X2 [Telopea speciosissima]
MEEQDVALPVSYSSSSIHVDDDPSGSAPSSSSSSLSEPVQEEENHTGQEQSPELQQQRTSVSYRVNISISDVASAEMGDDAWSFLVVLLSFWFFSSMTVIMGFYGSMNLQFGPSYSRLVQVNSIFVQDIKVREVVDQKSGPILYGFYKPPPLDVETTWSETRNISIPPNDHKEWIYYLNEGSEINISYSVKSQSSSPLSLVIAKGKENLVEWIEDPSYPNTTLSWNIIHGNGMIQQKIFKSSDYYVAVGNLNSEEAEMQLNLRVQAVLYNTTEAYYKCSVSRNLCSLNLFLLGTNVAVLTSPDPGQATDENWCTKLSYGPRWITYFVGSGGMTILILLAYKICNKFLSTAEEGTQFQAGDVRSERAPLLSQKDELSSLGSSYESVSHDEDDDLEEWLVASSLDSKPLKDGDNSNNPRRFCAICFDSPRDCFFLPCGHCAACFTCGTRIAEEAGMCPICRRKMKKVRKIFTI